MIRRTYEEENTHFSLFRSLTLSLTLFSVLIHFLPLLIYIFHLAKRSKSTVARRSPLSVKSFVNSNQSIFFLINARLKLWLFRVWILFFSCKKKIILFNTRLDISTYTVFFRMLHVHDEKGKLERLRDDKRKKRKDVDIKIAAVFFRVK